MKEIGMLKAILLCSKYSKMSETERINLQNERLIEMVNWAREKSPYYRKLYKNVGRDFKLIDLPPVNKVDLMKNYNEWITDKTITIEKLNEFMENLDNIGRKYKGKYLVYTTSGSTGNPLISINSSTVNSVSSAINIKRVFARPEDMKTFIKKGARTIGVFATGGFYLGNSSVRARLLSMPWKKKKVAVTSALLPTEEIVKQLNKFKPVMLGGYPSNLELLIDEQKSGRLHITPSIIMTGGEYLSDDLRKSLSNTFNCFVQTSYSCTEGGSVACECIKQHFHINDDWVIIEPVDKDNNPVADGVRSDKILLTNLYNYTQPYIRYEITDRIVMHHEKCGCGNNSPWITLEGRNDDVITLIENGKEIKLAPLAVYAVLKEIHEIQRFQLLVSKGSLIEFRLSTKEGYEKNDVFDKAKKTLINYFKIHGVTNVSIVLSDDVPKQHEKSGKFKHIINLDKC